MNKKFVDMHRHLSQIKRLNCCKIISQVKNGFCAEISLREGKYKILIDYSLNGVVDVYLLEPHIEVVNYTEIHTYGIKYHRVFRKELLKLCLTRPSKYEWNRRIPLAESFIPWAAEWTEFYELWLLTGVWYGGGEHPTID